MKPVLAAVLAVFCVPQDAADLKLSLKKEKAQRVRFIAEEDSESVAGGTTEKSRDRGRWEMGLETRGPAAEGLSTVHVTILRITRESRGRKFDTAAIGPADPPEAGVVRALVGEYVDADLTADGTLKELRGMKELEARFTAKLGLKPEAPGPQRGLKTMIEGRLREHLAVIFSIYPEKPGAPWTRKRSYTLGLAYHAEVTWSPGSRKDGRLALSGKGPLSPFPDADTRGLPLKQVQKLSGTAEGNLEVDLETGFPLTGKIVHQLSGTATMQGLSAPLPSDTFDQKSTLTFTVEAWDGK